MRPIQKSALLVGSRWTEHRAHTWPKAVEVAKPKSFPEYVNAHHKPLAAVVLATGLVIVLIARAWPWIFLVFPAVALVACAIGLARWAITNRAKRRAAQAAAAKREREERARKQKQQRIRTLGSENAALVEVALAAVKEVGASEAACAGWLGDVDFAADIRGIIDNFQKAHALRKVADKLSALDRPSVDDRKILAEAKTTTANLTLAAIERIELIGKCATEARLIDKSLCEERENAQAAEQRAELHGKLSAMLYGIETTPDTMTTDSAADAVMARVHAYREIKNQLGG